MKQTTTIKRAGAFNFVQNSNADNFSNDANRCGKANNLLQFEVARVLRREGKRGPSGKQGDL
jgi:hypothetical protein